MDVLVVEDDPAGRKSLIKALELAGFTVTAVDNGLAAIAELQQQHYRAIVCDIRMPYMDGIELFDQLRKDFPAMADRVLFISAWGHEPLVGSFLESTEQPFLPKPYDIDVLAGAVRGIAEQ